MQVAEARRKTPLVVAVAALVSMLIPTSAPGGDRQVPAELQGSILAKVLAYDTELSPRAGSEVVIGVLFRRGSSDSESLKVDMTKAFLGMAGQGIQRLPLRAEAVDFSSKALLEKEIESKGVDLLYVCIGLSDNLGEVLDVAETRHIPTLTGVEEYVGKGVAIGVSLRQNRPKILVNLTAAKAQGMKLTSEVLKLAELIEEGR